MSIFVTVDLRVDPARMDDFQALGEQLLPDTVAFDGCLSLVVLTDQDTPGAILFYQEWESREKYERYFQWRQDNGTLAQFGEFLTAPPAIRFFDK